MSVCLGFARQHTTSGIRFLHHGVANEGNAQATDNIGEIMLLGKHGGQADQNCHDKRINTNPFGYLRSFPDTQIAVNAAQAVVGGEQVEGQRTAIAAVHSAQQLIEKTGTGNDSQQSLRGTIHIGGGKNKNQESDDIRGRQADDVVDEISFFCQRGDNRPENPKYVGENIDHYENADHRNVVVNKGYLRNKCPGCCAGQIGNPVCQAVHTVLQTQIHKAKDPSITGDGLDTIDYIAQSNTSLNRYIGIIQVYLRKCNTRGDIVICKGIFCARQLLRQTADRSLGKRHIFMCPS